MAFLAKRDMGKCQLCGFAIVEGDSVTSDDDTYKHDRCEADRVDGHIVEWRYADSIDRAAWEIREEERVAPLGKQGKCPSCFIELPRTGICDEHGRPVAA